MKYTLEDGTEVEAFTQDEFDAKLATENAGIAANRDKAMDQAKAHKASLDAMNEKWGNLGISAEDVKDLVATQETAALEAAKKAGDWTSLEKQLTEKHATAMTGLKEAHAAKETKMMSTIESALVRSELTTAIAGAQGDVDLLLPHARPLVNIRETDNAFEAYVVNPDGSPSIQDGQGTPTSFAQLVETTLVTKYPGAFKGTGSRGSGASKSAAGGGGTKTIAAGDNEAFMGNLEGVADGTVSIQ